MGTENPGRPNFFSRSIAPPYGSVPPQTAGSYSQYGFVASPSNASTFRPSPSTRFTDPHVRPPPPPPPSISHAQPPQNFPGPHVPPTTQPVPFRGPPFASPRGAPVLSRIQAQPLPLASIAPPSHATNIPTNGANFGSSPQGSLLPPSRPSFSHGYPAVTEGPPVQQSFGHHQGLVAPPLAHPFQTSYGASSRPATPGLHSRGHFSHLASGPPSPGGLEEDFSSLSIGSVPGSTDPGINYKTLPRPLDGDVEPSLLTEMYTGNSHPRYIRLTTSAIPNSQSLLSRWHLPLGAVVCPLAACPKGEEVTVVNFTQSGIIRCRRCRTYVNPFVTFTDSGRKWRCNICTLLNDVPGDYYAHLDSNGMRLDLEQRPELCKGTVEFVAPAEYMVRPPMPPLYFFLIDVSQSAVTSGMLEVVAETIKSCLDDLSGYPRTQIGFITFDSTIHFYNMKSSLTQPQMMVVSDLDDVFVPLPDDLLVNLSESKTVIETFLDSLPSMFLNTKNVESALGPAIKAAFMIMSQLGGKLLIFQNTLPSLGYGRLRLRGDDLSVYGTEKEHALRIPEDPFYKQMSADLNKYQIGVDIYAFSDKYTDIASLGTLAKYTAGQVYYYPGFQSSIHRDKLRHELRRDLTRETGWEAVMRIRSGKGVRFSTFHGNFMLRSTDLLALPAVDCDKTFAMQLCLEETLLTTQTVYFQVSLLHTSSSGERRIRVHNLAAPVVTDLGEMYRQADIGAIISLFTRLAIEKTLTHKLEVARSSVQLKIVKTLREYRNLYAVQHRLGGRMIYPESLKFLALYGLALCKSTPLRGGFGDAMLDERCAVGYNMMALSVKQLLKALYPCLIRIDDILSQESPLSSEPKNMLKRLPLSVDSLDSRGLYIFDDGFRIVVWFGRMLRPEITMNIPGVDSPVELSKVKLSDGESEIARKLRRIVEKCREEDPAYYELPYLVRQGEQLREGLLLANLIEDQIGSANGYVDWILQIHRHVMQNA